MSSTSSWDVILRSRPLSTDVDAVGNTNARVAVDVASLIAAVSRHASNGTLADTGLKQVCSGMNVLEIGTTCSINVGACVTARPAAFPAAGPQDYSGYVLIENRDVLAVSLTTAGYYLIGARPTVITGSPMSMDVFNTSTGQFQNIPTPQDYTFGIAAYTVFDAANWPATTWTPLAGDVPLAIVAWNGTSITAISDLRSTPGDFIQGQALTDSGLVEYNSAQGFPATMYVTAQDVLVQGERCFAQGIDVSTLTPFLDQINGSSPVVQEQLYWVYMCSIQGRLPRDAYGVITAGAPVTRGLLVLSLTPPALGAYPNAPETGRAVRVNSTTMQLPTHLGGGTVAAGGSPCLGFIQTGVSAGQFRTQWSLGPNQHRFGQTLFGVAAAGTNWPAFAGAGGTPGTGAAMLTIPIMSSVNATRALPVATNLAKRTLLDVRMDAGGLGQIPSSYQAVDQNQNANTYAGDVLFSWASSDGIICLLRPEISGSRPNPTTIRLFASGVIPATVSVRAEILGYTW